MIEQKLNGFLENTKIHDGKDQDQLLEISSEDKPKDLGINTDHSVMIYGWGNDPVKGKYWLVRNSFGKQWGNNGDFEVALGQNDFGIEEEISGYNVSLCDT